MSRYHAAHQNPQGPGDARPTALQIIQDEGVEGALTDKTIVITGVSSGLGIETARALSTTGARLLLTARNVERAKDVLSDILSPGRVDLVEMDHTSLQSVRAGASQILAQTDKVNILINNAGIMAIQTLEFTKDGHELQFGVNHLAHFLFFELLRPALLAAVTPQFHSRVVVVASSAHLRNGINESDNYNFQKGGYEPLTSYAQSKTANIYMANEIERRYGSQGLHATSLHPGGILTPLAKHLPEAQLDAQKGLEGVAESFKSPEQGAATTVWAAIGQEWEGRGGRYLGNCAESGPLGDESIYTTTGYAKHAYDPVLEQRLWEDSMKLVGLA
ncbi:hypothetical protein FSARC_10382 [Fusarium sarcochroum]|uniref:Reductase n=1 Tax=Fusarium sarcochroum TaxID=1208366 RepID=A0A8H4X3P6_9HYPO|nr:hypothetical protein FSARC_10382 [Fusarium sarcochroum]